MKKALALAAALSVVALTLLFKSCTTSNSYNNNSPSADTCNASASWFPAAGGTPPPEEGANSPFANINTTTNCDFHQWAWQKFLYLASPGANGKANFESLVHVNNQLKQLGPGLILDDITQAGSSSALFDKQNVPVYYGIYVNDIMYRFSKQYLGLFKSCVAGDTLNPVAMHAAGYDTLTFPVGAFEVKTSWILASSLNAADTSNYYITQGTFINTNNTVRVALIGMHIIARVINHPELIWATYEHKQLAPFTTWPANYATDSVPDSTQVLSQQNSLFYNAGDQMKAMGIRRGSNDTSVGLRYFVSTYHLFDHGTQPKYTSMVPALSVKDSNNLVTINNLNASVFSHLNTMPGPWKNYEYMGAVWIDPTVATLQPGDSNIGALTRMNLRGSRAISNITMETYAQLNYNQPAPGQPGSGLSTPINSMNCFGCHATMNFNVGVNGAAYNLALSHIFDNSFNDTLAAISAQAKNVKNKKELKRRK